MSFDSLSATFESEFKKFEALLDEMFVISEFSISQIVSIYHMVLNLNSLIAVLKSQGIANSDAEKLISDKFDMDLHPKILEQLSGMISTLVDSLQSKTNNDSLSYDNLRELMSTKEFVEQYAKGLLHD